MGTREVGFCSARGRFFWQYGCGRGEMGGKKHFDGQRDRFGFVPFSLYLTLSLVVFGRGLLGAFTTTHLGVGEDPPLMMWFLVWWPHAIANGLNPVLTRAIWAPSGFNLTWQTSIPLISIVAAPITAILGPIGALNLLCLLSIPITAWCAFILCRYVSGSYGASILGGFIFGFSPFMLSQLKFGHLHTLYAFPIPLSLYLAARLFNREIAVRRFILLLGLLLMAEFLFSIEVFATMTIFAMTTFAIAWLLGKGEVRGRLTGMIAPLAISYCLALIAVSPLLYCFFAIRFQSEPIWPVAKWSADLFNFLIPTPVNLLGIVPVFDRISGPFNGGNVPESSGYIAVPLIVAVAAFVRRNRGEMLGRVLIDALIVIVLCSLGPFLVVGGKQTRIGLPWALLQVPVLNNAEPARFSMYIHLDLAILVSLWIARASLKPALKGAAGAAIVVFMLPNMTGGFWTSSATVPEFFRAGLYRKYLARDETVVMIPWGPRGESMLWQAMARMYFRMAGGAGPPPKEFRFWPIVEALTVQRWVPDAPAQLDGFITSHNVGAVIVEDEHYGEWRPLLSTLGVAPRAIGGVRLYEVPAAIRAGPEPDLLALRKRYDVLRFETLVGAAQRFIASGGSANEISVQRVWRLGLVPNDWIVGPPEAYTWLRDPEDNWSEGKPDFEYGLWLFPLDGRIVAGERAWYPAVKGLIEKYQGVASEVHFVPPPGTSARARSETIGSLVMGFSPEQLAVAAKLSNDASMTSEGAKRLGGVRSE